MYNILLSLQVKINSMFFPLPFLQYFNCFDCLLEMFDYSPKLGFLWELLSQVKDEVIGELKFDG